LEQTIVYIKQENESLGEQLARLQEAHIASIKTHNEESNGLKEQLALMMQTHEQ